MAVILWLMGLTLFTQSCLCSLGQTENGCKLWTQSGRNVCCEECHPGNRMVRKCGPDPEKLCTPCEPGTYTLNPKAYRCDRCTECVGAQVHLKDCTTKTDTKCGCKDGLACGNEQCSFCMEKCAKGYEPTDDRSCRPCPDGTFRDESHTRCQPWSTRCPQTNQKIVVKGNASSDIQCITESHVTKPSNPDHENQAWPLLFIVVITMSTFCITIVVFIIIMALKYHQRRKKKITKPLPPTESHSDEPRTLMAIECSFHEAQQEQGSNSTESLISKEASEQLIA